MEKGRLKQCDFQYLGGLGAGGFGEVVLVRLSQDSRWKHRPNRLAVKQQEKVKGSEELQFMELKISRAVRNCPFVTQLLGSWHTSRYLFMVTEYYSGGSLQDHIAAKTHFGDKQVALLAAELSLAICLLQSKYNIIHRDIKPDNIVFDRHGHAKVIDLGIACYKLDPQLLEPCGTSFFVAPEAQKEPVNYDQLIDWWAVGVTLLSVIQKTEDPYTLFDSSQLWRRDGFHMQLVPGWKDFHLGVYTLPMKEYLQGLLKQDPRKRLGPICEAMLRKKCGIFHLLGLANNDARWEAFKRGEYYPPLDHDQFPSQSRMLPTWPELQVDEAAIDTGDYFEIYHTNYFEEKD